MTFSAGLFCGQAKQSNNRWNITVSNQQCKLLKYKKSCTRPPAGWLKSCQKISDFKYFPWAWVWTLHCTRTQYAAGCAGCSADITVAACGGAWQIFYWEFYDIGLWSAGGRDAPRPAPWLCLCFCVCYCCSPLSQAATVLISWLPTTTTTG